MRRGTICYTIVPLQAKTFDDPRLGFIHTLMENYLSTLAEKSTALVRSPAYYHL